MNFEWSFVTLFGRVCAHMHKDIVKKKMIKSIFVHLHKNVSVSLRKYCLLALYVEPWDEIRHFKTAVYVVRTPLTN